MGNQQEEAVNATYTDLILLLVETPQRYFPVEVVCNNPAWVVASDLPVCPVVDSVTRCPTASEAVKQVGCPDLPLVAQIQWGKINLYVAPKGSPAVLEGLIIRQPHLGQPHLGQILIPPDQLIFNPRIGGQLDQWDQRERLEHLEGRTHSQVLRPRLIHQLLVARPIVPLRLQRRGNSQLGLAIQRLSILMTP